MRYSLLIAVALIFSLPTFAQQKTADGKDAAKKEKTNAKVETEVVSKSKGPKAKVPYRFMANVHAGIGLMNYFGDLRDKQGTTVHRVGNRATWNFGIGGNLTNWLDLNIDVMMGSMTWSQNRNKARIGEVPLNFEAEIFTAGASLTYNFKNFIRNPTSINPFISVGVSYSDYDVYSDLVTTDKDGMELTYYYWEDGQIYSVDQNSPLSEGRDPIQRDFDYETRLNEFPITAVAIPVGVGLDFNASRKFAIRIGTYYYFSTTDKMDNVVGGDKGFLSNDGFLYTSLSAYFKFDPFKKKAKKVEVPEGMYDDMAGLEDEDSDGDGVTDFFDRCGGTPKGLSVDDHGCPADDDKDGIPDYRDKQLNTAAGRIVDPNGVAISYKEIYKTYGKDTASLLRSEIDQEWLMSPAGADTRYTVHVGTYTNYDIPTQLKIKLSKMEGLVEHKVNDSLSVFTVGEYDNFEDAEIRQNELIKEGIDEAFGVNDDYIPEVGEQIGVLDPKLRENQPQGISLDMEDVDVVTYGIELREYRLRIQLDRLSKLIARHGVEMKTTEGGMKIYTIGAFATHAEAEVLQREVIKLGVKNPAITAKHNNREIEIEDALKMEDGNGGE